jgi:hypothetical protein
MSPLSKIRGVTVKKLALFSVLALTGCGHQAIADGSSCITSHRDTVWEYPEKYGSFLEALEVASASSGKDEFHEKYRSHTVSLLEGGVEKIVFARSRKAITVFCDATENHEHTTEYYLIKFSVDEKSRVPTCLVERRTFIAPFSYPDLESVEFKVPISSDDERCADFLKSASRS